MSATVPRGLPAVPQPVPAPPQPGFEGLVQPMSCVPKPVVKGVPIFSPWPGISTQFAVGFRTLTWAASVRPASAQVEGLIPVLTTPEPGKVRYFAAMLAGGANAAKAGVSYHPLPVLLELGLRTVS